MTADEVRRFVERYVATLQSLDPVGLAEAFAPNGTVDSPSAGVHHGRKDIAATMERWFAAFPDMSVRVENLVADVDQAAAFVRISATHQGEFMGLPPTGKKIEFTVVYFQRYENELIVHERRLYDFSAVLIQLGLLKVRPS